jgi:hypothetical protein
MRRFFIFLVLIASLVAFFNSQLADDLLNKKQYSMTNWFNKISKSAEAKVMENFRQDAASILSSLSNEQAEYATHVMKDRQTLGVFYLRYCKGNDINPYIFGVNREEFCELIGNADILNH